MAKRFYQIAFELGLMPRPLIRELSDHGLSVGNQMVIIPDELEARIREIYDIVHPVEEEVQAVEEVAPPIVDVPAEVVAETPVEVPVDAPEEVVTEAVATGAADGVVAEAEVDTEAVVASSNGPVEAPVEEPVEAPAAEEAPETPEVPEAPVEAPAETDEPQGTPEEPAKEEPARKPSKPLIPSIDPRAGRLVKDAPAGGIPGVTRPRRPAARGRGDMGSLTPSIPQPDRAPGARRESGRRTVADRYRGKRGKETFQMRKRGRRGQPRPVVPKVRPTSIEVELPITVKGFGELSGYKAAEIIKTLFREHKMFLNTNANLDKDTVELLALELEIDVTFVQKETAEDALLKKFEAPDTDEDLIPRPPVVTILGHVDHGKTTLLDYIRRSDVAAKEAGGITQHISAYQVTTEGGHKLTFLDTPGHEAFTQMRARGAQVTDIVILIVAADDGVMPQTIEAISHAKAADVEIVVAITKCDREQARPERVKQQLAEHDIFVEGYGGDVSVYEVSGITGQGVPELLEHLALMAEVDADRYRANPDRLAQGTVIEAQNSPKRGIVATVLIQNGTLRKGDPVIAGLAYGTVRALFDDKGQQIKEAGPSTPCEIIGLDRAPEAGAKVYAADKGSTPKEIVEARRTRSREAEVAAQSKPQTIDALLGAIDAKKVEGVNLVVKADVDGSLHPLKTVLERLSTEEVKVNIIHAAVGAVNESDVVLASASQAWIIAFHVNVDAKARTAAKREHVEIRSYRVIYDIEADVRDLMEGKLAPEMEEVIIGHAEVLQIFSFSKVGNIAGCRVKDGLMRRDALVRVKRGDEVIHESQLATLRREKDSAREVKEGLECGLTVAGWDEFEPGDVIEAYKIEAKRRTLAKS